MKHYLNFIKPNYGKVEITEPFGFDAFSSKITQAKERFGRDKEIGGGVSAELEFGKVYGKKTTPYITVDGSLVEVLTHRLDLIFKAIEENGSESEIEYVLEDNGSIFTTGLIDVSESETDTFRSFKCTVVQNTNKALIERKKDVIVDVFSDRDTFNDGIVPLQKERILLKAKPTFELSEWSKKELPNVEQVGNALTADIIIPISNGLQNYGIKDSLAPFDPFYKGFNTSIGDIRKIVYANRVIQTKTQLTNLKISIKGLSLIGFSNIGKISLNVVQSVYNDEGIWQSGVSTDKLFEYDNNITLEDEDFEFTIPFVSSGVSIAVYVSVFSSVSGVVSHVQSIQGYSVRSMKITATSTGVDSVIFGVSEYDYFKQGVKSLSKLPIDANILKNDKYVFNGSLIRQKEDTALNFKFSDEANDLLAFMQDYQINENNIEVLSFTDYYQNIDMGLFNILPEEGFSRVFNDRFKNITLTFGFKTFEQNRNEKNTVDAVHTEAQFLLPNTQVEGDLKRNVNAIYDPFTIETSRREAVDSTTSLSTDDKIFKIDTVAIPEGSTNIYKGVLTMRAVAPYRLEILANNFNWTLLGFNNGDDVVLTGVNAGSYFVLQHSESLLELVNNDSILPPFSGTSYIEIEYPLTNVSLMNRTNEGFDFIEGIEVPENFSNLKYTIKRILNNEGWNSFLSSMCKDTPNGIIKNTEFKVNGELASKFMGGALLKENADIPVPDGRIINKYVYKTTIAVGFERANQLINDAKNIKGFIRVLDPFGKILRVHLQDMTMIWARGIMDITAEARNEVDFVTLEIVPGGVKIFEVGYDFVIRTDLEWFKSDNGYFQIFDNDSKPLINPTKYDKIKIDGIIYSTDVLLYNKLLSL